MRLGRPLLAAAAVALTACTAILGVRDLSYDPNAEAGAPGDDGGAKTDEPNGTDSGGDDGGSTACGDTQSDSKNCGRCGRDCLGAACANGSCADTVLVQGLGNPNGIFVDGTYVYMTTYTDGTVLREKKTGGTVDVLATGQTHARGIVSDGTNLYWSNGDFRVDAGGGNMGGVWKCSLANCTGTKALVTSGEWAFNVTFANGLLYFVENNNNNLVKVQPDGNGRTSYGTSNKPFAAIADGTHVYFNSDNPSLQRVLLNFTTPEDFASFGPNFLAKGYITLDATSVYYTFIDGNNVGQAVAAPKDPIGAPKIVFGTNNDPSVGIAVDDTYVYWATEKTSASGDPDGSGGKLLACKKTGCEGDPVVLLQTSTGGVMASDGKAVYFAESGVYGQPNGKLHMVARP